MDLVYRATLTFGDRPRDYFDMLVKINWGDAGAALERIDPIEQAWAPCLCTRAVALGPRWLSVPDAIKMGYSVHLASISGRVR